MPESYRTASKKVPIGTSYRWFSTWVRQEEKRLGVEIVIQKNFKGRVSDPVTLEADDEFHSFLVRWSTSV